MRENTPSTSLSRSTTTTTSIESSSHDMDNFTYCHGLEEEQKEIVTEKLVIK